MINLKPSYIVAAFLFFSFHGLAGKETGGGDEVGLEFRAAFLRALSVIQKDFPALDAKLKEGNLESIAAKTHFITVDHPLYVSIDGTLQECVATNDPETMTVKINRKRWSAIQSSALREGIALHEVASLGKYESTGKYPISSVYVAGFGLATRSLLAGSEIEFDSAQCIRSKIVGRWKGIATTPWTTPYQVTFEFREDGTYSAHGGLACLGNSSPIPPGKHCDPQSFPALYYGSDEESPNKLYSIEQANNGEAIGLINVFFSEHSIVENELKSLRLLNDAMDKKLLCTQLNQDEDPTYLQFKVYHMRQYGPISFSLRRTN